MHPRSYKSIPFHIPEAVARPELFCKKCVLKNFAKFTGKHLRQSLSFKKVKKKVFI